MSSETDPIVIVLGSSTIYAGWAGSDNPSCVAPSVVGTAKKNVEQMMVGVSPTTKYAGDMAMCERGFLSLDYPIERGVVKDWDNFETLMHDTFYNHLRVCPEEYSVLITESPLNPKINREKLTQVFFECFKVPQLRIEIDALLPLYANGRTTGVSVSSGGGVTSVLPVYDGYAVRRAMKRLDLGGSDVTEYLSRLLTERGYYFTTSTDREIVRKVKESLAYVALDFNQAMAENWSVWSSEMEKVYELPDCSKIMISTQLFQCTECLFQPLKQLGREQVGTHQLIRNSIKECDIDIRRDLYGSIVLSGGNTLLPGYSERIHKELTNLVPPKSMVRIVSPPERKYSTWIGGCVVASYSHDWVDRTQYDEDPNAMHRFFY